MELLFEPILDFIYQFSWRDVVEILFLSFCVYYFSLWLKKDRQKNLLGYFYTYCLVTLCAHGLELTSISYFLVLCAPVAIVCLTLIHQKTLQKNFVTMRNMLPKQDEENVGWLDVIFRTCLIALNNNKQIHCVIERADSLKEIVTTPLALHADVKKELLDILFESSSYDSSKMLWVNAQGKILGINASWDEELHEEEWTSPAAKQEHKWQQDALIFTAKTDALVFRVNPNKRSFDVVIQGKTFEQLSAANALKCISNYLNQATLKGGIPHATQSEDRTIQQRDA